MKNAHCSMNVCNPGHLTHLLCWTKRGKKTSIEAIEAETSKEQRTTRRKQVNQPRSCMKSLLVYQQLWADPRVGTTSLDNITTAAQTAFGE
jgi:hypothetical protein